MTSVAWVRNGLGIYPRQARSGAPSVAMHLGAEAFHQRNLLSDAYASNSMSDDIRRDQRPIEEKRHQLSRGQLDPMSLEPLRIFWELKMEEVKRRLMEAGPAKETSSPTWIWRCARWTARSLDSAQRLLLVGREWMARGRPPSVLKCSRVD